MPRSSSPVRLLPRSMPAARCSGEEYIGVRSPVAAQCTRLPTASALAARCAVT